MEVLDGHYNGTVLPSLAQNVLRLLFLVFKDLVLLLLVLLELFLERCDIVVRFQFLILLDLALFFNFLD